MCNINIPRTLHEHLNLQGSHVQFYRDDCQPRLKYPLTFKKMDQTSHRVRKRIPQSCKRCRRRKQKCVGFPICANCREANLPCERSTNEQQTTISASERYHGVSKDLLFSRIETLEAQLSAMSADCGASHKAKCAAGNVQFSDLVNRMTSGYVVGDERAHIGLSSGKMIAASLDLMMKDAVQMNVLSDASSREEWHGPSHISTQTMGPPSIRPGRIEVCTGLLRQSPSTITVFRSE